MGLKIAEEKTKQLRFGKKFENSRFDNVKKIKKLIVPNDRK